MSISSADVNKAIAKNRETYLDASRELKKSHKHELENQKRVSESQIENLKDSQNNRIEDIVAFNEDKLLSVNDRVKKQLEYQDRNYKETLGEKTKAFRDERDQLKSKFDREVGDISSAYNKSLKENNHLNENNLKRSKSNLLNRMDNILAQSENTNKDIKEKSDAQIDAVTKEAAKQNKDNIRANEDRFQDLVKSTNQRENLLKDGFRSKYDELNRTNDDNVKTMRNQQANVIEDARRSSGNEVYEVIDKYKGMLEKQAQNSKNSEKSLLHQNNMKLDTLEKDNKQEIYKRDRKLEEIFGSNGPKEEYRTQLAELNSKNDNRYSNLKNKNLDFMIDRNQKVDELESDYKSSLADLQIENGKTLLKKENNFNKRLDEQQQYEGRRSANANQKLRDKVVYVTGEKEKELVAERRAAKNLLEGQRETFAKSLNDMQDKNTQLLDELNTNFKNEKEKLLAEGNKNLFNTTNAQRKEFGERMQNLVDNYENKLQAMEEHNKKAVNELVKNQEAMERKFLNQIKTIKEFEAEVQAQEKDRLLTDLETTRKTMAAENQNTRDTFKSKMMAMEEAHQNEMDKLKIEHQSILQKTQLENQKKFYMEIGRARNAYNSLLVDTKSQREELIKGYEARLEDMNNMYKQTLANLQAENKRQGEFKQEIS